MSQDRSEFQTKFRTSIQRRSTVLIVGVFAVSIWIAIRLFSLQILRHDEIKARAEAGITQSITLTNPRGIITDRQGNVLAIDVERESLWVVPSQIDIERAPKVASTLAPLINKDPSTILEEMTNTDSYWRPLARWLDDQTARQIEVLDEPGLLLFYETMRLYPHDTLAAHVIGNFTTSGLAGGGIEQAYNDILAGKPGSLTGEFDGARNLIWLTKPIYEAPQGGSRVVLTIDARLQQVAEEALATNTRDGSVVQGTVIIIDSANGAIQALAHTPTFNPNDYRQSQNFINSTLPAVAYIYEPRGVFPLFTIAAGLETGVLSATTVITDTGVLESFGERITSNGGSGFGPLTPREVLATKSRVGAMLLGQLIDMEDFYRVIRTLGFGTLTNINFGGATQGILNQPTDLLQAQRLWLRHISGYGLAVTDLQVVQALATIANDGLRVTPYIVDKICAPNNNCSVTQTIAPERVLRTETARDLMTLLSLAPPNTLGEQVTVSTSTSTSSTRLYVIEAGAAAVPILEKDEIPPTEDVSMRIAMGVVETDTRTFVVYIRLDDILSQNDTPSATMSAFMKIAEHLPIGSAELIERPNGGR